MPDIATRKQELEQKIDSLTEKLEALRGELKEIREAEQHAAIDRLEDHMDDANISLVDIRRFWRQMMREVRGEKSE